MCLKYFFYNEQHACPKPFICNMIVSNNKIKNYRHRNTNRIKNPKSSYSF